MMIPGLPLPATAPGGDAAKEPQGDGEFGVALSEALTDYDTVASDPAPAASQEPSSDAGSTVIPFQAHYVVPFGAVVEPPQQAADGPDVSVELPAASGRFTVGDAPVGTPPDAGASTPLVATSAVISDDVAGEYGTASAVAPDDDVPAPVVLVSAGRSSSSPDVHISPVDSGLDPSVSDGRPAATTSATTAAASPFVRLPADASAEGDSPVVPEPGGDRVDEVVSETFGGDDRGPSGHRVLPNVAPDPRSPVPTAVPVDGRARSTSSSGHAPQVKNAAVVDSDGPPVRSVADGDEAGPASLAGVTAGTSAPDGITTTGPRTTAVQAGGAVARLVEVVERLRAAPPPQRIVVELTELDGLRVQVSLDGSTVKLAVVAPGAGAQSINDIVGELSGALADRGFDLSGGSEDHREAAEDAGYVAPGRNETKTKTARASGLRL